MRFNVVRPPVGRGNQDSLWLSNLSKVMQLVKNKIEIQTLDSLVLDLSLFFSLWFFSSWISMALLFDFLLQKFSNIHKSKENNTMKSHGPTSSFNNYQHSAVSVSSYPNPTICGFFLLENFKTKAWHGISPVSSWVHICRALFLIITCPPWLHFRKGL